MKPTFFATPSEFRKWLKKNHATIPELLVGFHRKGSGRRSITWPESVDEALCFGWIDGVRKSLGDNSYTIRFSPRRPTSIWSAVNIKRARELKKLGLMTQAGLDAFQRRDAQKTRRYSFERKNITFDPSYVRKIRENTKAWTFFQSLTPSMMKPSMWWVMSAKKEETRVKRLDILISSSAAGQLIPPLRFGRDR